jgi:lysozyme
MLKLLNAGNYQGAAEQFDSWDHAGGKVVAGLLRRRQIETNDFEK